MLNKQSIQELISSQDKDMGFTLDQEFYTDEDIFQIDYQSFFLNHWIFIDHESSLKKIGDYILFNLNYDSVRITKLKDRVVAKYTSSGKDCCLEIFEGLIFLNFSHNPDNFDEFIAPVKDFIKFHDLANAKIAYRKTYPTRGNWKLTLDNFYECYHCGPAHPEYCEVHSAEYIQSFGAGSNSGPVSDKFNKELEEWNKKVSDLGHLTGSFEEKNLSYYFRGAERTPLSNGNLSETIDGTPVSILMGKFRDFDGGYTTIGISPFNSMLMVNDFATLFRFVPRSTLQTDVELLWLVDKDAILQDADIKKMIWMWDKTTIADQNIIENNQKGVLSSHYAPGKLSDMELKVKSFRNWYLRRLENIVK